MKVYLPTFCCIAVCLGPYKSGLNTFSLVTKISKNKNGGQEVTKSVMNQRKKIRNYVGECKSSRKEKRKCFYGRSENISATVIPHLHL